MFTLLTIGLIAVITAALLVLAYYWWLELDFPSLLGFVTRVLAGAAITVPVALWVLSGEMQMSREMSGSAPQSMPPADTDGGTAGEDQEQAREPSGGSAPPAAANGHSPPASVRETSPSRSQPPAGSAAPRKRLGAPKTTAPPSADAPALPGGEPEAATAPPDAAELTPATEPSADHADWSIVPVFYGTDRQRNDVKERIAYDWQRGRRLELGRALVTIPKDHVVPMIERPWAIRIPYIDVTLYEAAEDPKRHFTINELKALTKEEFLTLVKARLAASARFEDHALVFVHGYKTTFDNAIYRTAQITYDLKFDGAPFLYSWPSGGTLQGYTYDRESAAQAEPFFYDFLQTVVRETEAKKVSIIAHSMGNQLLLRVLQDLKRSLPEGVRISQLILAAPDVDRHSFENIVRSINGIADGITLYSAANDQALLVSRRVNGGVPRAGDVPDDGPIILQGVDTIDATASSMDSVGINHSGYAENNALLDDIGRLISSGVRPPEKRLPTLERVTTDRGIYWRYPVKEPGVAGSR